MTKKDLLKRIENIESTIRTRSDNMNQILDLFASEFGKEIKVTKVVEEGWDKDYIVEKYELVKKTKNTK